MEQALPENSKKTKKATPKKAAPAKKASAKKSTPVKSKFAPSDEAVGLWASGRVEQAGVRGARARAREYWKGELALMERAQHSMQNLVQSLVLSAAMANKRGFTVGEQVLLAISHGTLVRHTSMGVVEGAVLDPRACNDWDERVEVRFEDGYLSRLARGQLLGILS